MIGEDPIPGKTVFNDKNGERTIITSTIIRELGLCLT